MYARFMAAAVSLACLVPAVAADAPAAAWGKPVSGLRAGFVVEGKSPYALGDDVRLTVYFKNVSKTPIVLEYYRPELLGWSPVMKTEKGEGVPMSSPPFDYPVMPATTTLKPGETFRFGSTTLALRGPTGPFLGEVLSSTATCAPGRYRLTFPFRFQPREQNAAAWSGELTTGKTTLVVR